MKITQGDFADEERARNLGIGYTLYLQCYCEALKVILRNINENADRTDGVKCQNREDGFLRNTGRMADSNIIAFVGDRGSGKTTAVSEFCRILQMYSQRAEKWNEEIGYQGLGGRTPYFHVMNPIDASVLGTKEDLVEVILASMYREFQKELDDIKDDRWGNTRVQNILQEFDEVYKGYVMLGSRKEQDILGESVLAKLRDISNSLKVKTGMEKLIRDFLLLMDEKAGCSGRDSYLVLTIDDLDMSPENGYEMLEQLHRYLLNLKTIILVTVKYEQVKLLCDKHFVDALMPEYGGMHEDIYRRTDKDARRLSSDYLLKVLPISSRIYMPERSLLEKKALVSSKEQEEPIRVKKYILKKIAQQTTILYDGMGMKRHFCMPETVRELVAYDDFLNELYSMEEIEALSDEKRRMELYDQNHERFNRDIEHRMAIQILDDEQMRIYRLIMSQGVERRASYAVNFLGGGDDAGFDGEKSSCLVDKVDDQTYCYSDLLEVLYKRGRARYEDKTLIHCILASFTSEMVREYYSYRNNPEQEKRDKAAERLRNFLGQTAGGGWYNEVAPAIATDQTGRGIANYTYITDGSLEKERITLRYAKEDIVNEDGELEPDVLLSILPCMECVTLLLTNFRDATGRPTECRWVFTLKEGMTEEGNIVMLTIGNQADRADFDMFGFIGREIKNPDNDFSHSVHENLTGAMAECIADFMEANKTTRAKGKMRKKFVLPDQLSEEESAFAFPYYNLDLSYNIMKRVRKKMKGIKALKEKDICSYFRRVYGYMAEELKAQDDYYEKLLGENGQPHYYDAFTSSPFIRAFGTEKKDGERQIDGKLRENKYLNIIMAELLRGFSADSISNLKQQMQMQDIDS